MKTKLVFASSSSGKKNDRMPNLRNRHFLLFACFFCLLGNMLSAQQKFWIYGNQLVSFTASGVDTSPLPTPGSNPLFHYTGNIPQKNQHAQYSSTGDLLFFIVDGTIYDGEGYVIARNLTPGVGGIANQDEGKSFLLSNSASVGVVGVPGFCDKFYLFTSYQVLSLSTDHALAVFLLDMSAQNTWFPSDVNRKGALLDQEDNDPLGLAPAFYSVLGSSNNPDNFDEVYNGMVIDGGDLAKGDNWNFEIMEVTESKKIVFCSNPYGTTKIFALSSNYANLIDEVFEDYSNIPDNANWGSATFGSSDSYAMGSSEFRVVFTNAWQNVSSLSVPDFFTVVRINFAGIIETELNVSFPVGSVGSITDFEFSPDGTHVWFTKKNAPHIGVVELSTGNVSYPITGNTEPYRYSMLERQVNELGEEVIYAPNASGLFELHNPNTPSLAFLSVSGWAAGFTPTTFTDVSTTMYSLPIQNSSVEVYNTFLAGAECCETSSDFESIAGYVHSSNTAVEWSYESNPWNATGPVHFSGDLVFLPGSKVTISNMEFRFDNNVKVVINQDANVELKDGTLWTSYVCDNIMWAGVIVEGSSSQSQTPFVVAPPINAGLQGFLLMRNSQIENAILGVNVIKGAVLYAIESTFRNNQTDVRLNSYERFTSQGQALANRSAFNDCLFITDAPLKRSWLSPKIHLDIKRVVKIRIRNCSFMCTTDLNVHPWLNRGIGINVERGSIKVQGTQNSWNGTSEPLTGNTTFYHLTQGIYFSGFNFIRSFQEVKGMQFQSCFYGISNYNADNAQLVLNNFFIPEADDNLVGETERGIYITGSTGYTIEQNRFRGVDDTSVNNSFPASLGIWVDNSGAYHNLIRNNDFEALRQGIHVTRNNWLPIRQGGLQLLCNDFALCRTDIYRAAHSTLRENQGGIQPLNYENGTQQLELDIPAGNRFSLNTPDCDANHDFIVDPVNSHFNDYVCHSDLNTIPDCVTISDIDGTQLLDALVEFDSYDPFDCPLLHSLGNSMPGGGISLPGLMERLDSVRIALLAAQENYQAVVDKNQTEAIILAMDNAYPGESQYLRNLLLANFPLSDEVLEHLMVQATKLDPWHLTEVFLANSPLHKNVLSHLDQSGILSPFFLSFIHTYQDGTGLRKLMEMNITRLASLCDVVIQDIAKQGMAYDFMPDEEQEEVIYDAHYWQAISENETMGRRRTMASTLAHSGDYAGAQALIAADSSLQTLALFWQYLQLQEDDYKKFSDAQIANVLAAYNKPDEESRYYALAILHEIGVTDEQPEPTEPIQFRSLVDRASDEETSALPLLGVWPNPANEGAYIHYPVEAEGHGQVVIYDATGKIVDTLSLQNRGLLPINVQDYSDGLYMISLIVEGKPMESIKFNVTH
jgi:hypothetical protein